MKRGEKGDVKRGVKGGGTRRRSRVPAGSALPLGIRLVYEDDEIAVVDKPPGVLSAAPRARSGARSGAREESVFGALRGRWPEIRIIHRLDQAASGLLVFAKTGRAFGWLKEDLRARRLERSYLAVVEGELGAEGAAPASGSVQSFLGEARPGRVASVPLAEARGGRPRGSRDGSGDPNSADPRSGDPRLAVTHYRALAVGRGRSLVELTLDTGRKHQIRVHMMDLGHAVVGDRRYGSARRGENPLARIALHAAALSFEHPATGERMRFESPAPRGFFALVGARAPKTAPEKSPAKVPRPARRGDLETSWEHVADWYDELLEERTSDHHRDLILPGTLRLLAPRPGLRVLDVGCGQGMLCRALATQGASAVGVDASARLIELARRRSAGALCARISYAVGDVRELGKLELGLFDAAAAVMSLANLEPIEPVLAGVASLLGAGGSFVAVLPHPAFRAARQTSWGFDQDQEGHARQYRRVDGYLSTGQARIVQNPGEVAAGKPAIETWSFHRPIQTYARALASAGLWIDRLEEWPSLRSSDSGPRASEENRARREIPLFLALRARKVAARD